MYIIALLAALCFGGSHSLVAAATDFSAYSRLWQQAAATIASAEHIPAHDWYAGGGSTGGFAWAWEDVNGEFNQRTYDHLNSLVTVASPHTAQSSGTSLLTNAWFHALTSISYELSADDRARVNALTSRGTVLQTQLVVEYERAIGVISDAMRTEAANALTARNFTTFPAHQMQKVDYIVTYQLDYMWSCRARDNVAPRHYNQFQEQMMRFVRSETGLVTKSATDPSLLDVEDIVPSERMRRAFLDMFPCMPTAAATRASLAGKFLPALLTQMFVFDASARYTAYPFTAEHGIREAMDIIQNTKKAKSAANTRVRDRNGNVETVPAFHVHRDVLDVYNNLKATTTRRVRTRVATVSIGDTTIASVRMAVRHDGNDFDVSLPELVPHMSLITPANAAKLIDQDKENKGEDSTDNKVDPNYYRECIELEFADGYSMIPVGPATMQISPVNDTFVVTGGGWFDSAPLVGAVANEEEDRNAAVLRRKTSGYHWSSSSFMNDGYDYSKGGNFGVAGAYLITSARSFSSQCRGRMFTEEQAASLRDAMKGAGDASFAGWTSGRGVLDEKDGGFPARDWDDGDDSLQYSLRDIKASLAATPSINPEVAAALLGTDDDKTGGLSVGGSANFVPTSQLIGEPTGSATADVMATRIVWPGVDVNAFQTTVVAVDGVSTASPTDQTRGIDDDNTSKATKHHDDGYSFSAIVTACAVSVLAGVILGALVQRKCRGPASASQGLLSDQYGV